MWVQDGSGTPGDSSEELTWLRGRLERAKQEAAEAYQEAEASAHLGLEAGAGAIFGVDEVTLRPIYIREESMSLMPSVSS